MTSSETHLRLSPLLFVVAAIILLLTATVLGRTYVAPPAVPPAFDEQNHAPDVLLVRRDARADVFGNPRPSPMPRRSVTPPDTFPSLSPGEPSLDPARLDGVLMDDRQLLAAVCCLA